MTWLYSSAWAALMVCAPGAVIGITGDALEVTALSVGGTLVLLAYFLPLAASEHLRRVFAEAGGGKPSPRTIHVVAIAASAVCVLTALGALL